MEGEGRLIVNVERSFDNSYGAVTHLSSRGDMTLNFKKQGKSLFSNRGVMEIKSAGSLTFHLNELENNGRMEVQCASGSGVLAFNNFYNDGIFLSFLIQASLAPF